MSPFDIGVRVRIRTLGLVGAIDAMFRDVLGIQWRVQYLSTTGEVQSIYVAEQNLEVVH
jgi:hypothetical protein